MSYHESQPTPEQEQPHESELGGLAVEAAVQYRTEHSRSIEDAEKFKALETLKELGVLVPVTELESTHGRAAHRSDTKDWSVDPAFKNGGDDSGNNNLHRRPTLYTSDKDVAKRFAQARGGAIIREKINEKLIAEIGQEDPIEFRKRELAKRLARHDAIPEDIKHMYQKPNTDIATGDWTNSELRRETFSRYEDAEPEVRSALWKEASSDYALRLYDIVSSDTDATILNTGMKLAEMSPEDTRRYFEAVQALTIPLSMGAPGEFDDHSTMRQSYVELNEIYNTKSRDGNWPRLGRDDIADVMAKTGGSQSMVTKTAAAMNARTKLFGNIGAAANVYMAGDTDIVAETVDGSQTPTSLEYLGKFFREAHIVGAKQSVDSATLGERIDVVAFFDLEKVNSDDQYESARSEALAKLQPIATDLAPAFEWRGHDQPTLFNFLNDAHAKPHKIVEAAKQVAGFDQVFEADAGNWEGYSLEEHTGTVLRNFDENFADEVPVGLLAPLRLAMVAHDIGKPEAHQAGQKHRQKEYNAIVAQKFFEELDVDPRTADFLQSLIGEGMELAANIIVKGRTDQIGELRKLAHDSLQGIHEGDVSEDMIDGYVDLCEKLFICDGGAYTTMAVTRDPKLGYNRNAGSFNSSFHEPVGPGKRDLKLRRGGIASRT